MMKQARHTQQTSSTQILLLLAAIAAHTLYETHVQAGKAAGAG